MFYYCCHWLIISAISCGGSTFLANETQKKCQAKSKVLLCV